MNAGHISTKLNTSSSPLRGVAQGVIPKLQTPGERLAQTPRRNSAPNKSATLNGEHSRNRIIVQQWPLLSFPECRGITLRLTNIEHKWKTAVMRIIFRLIGERRYEQDIVSPCSVPLLFFSWVGADNGVVRTAWSSQVATRTRAHKKGQTRKNSGFGPSLPLTMSCSY